MKYVHFDLSKNVVYDTYSFKEYDRHPIENVVYQKMHGLISPNDINTIYVNLDLYKLYEMNVHVDSLHNNLYHNKLIP